MPDKTLLILRINAKNQENEKALKQLKTTKTAELKDLKEEEIGFGIKVIKAVYLIKEKDEQAAEKLVKEISAMESVENAEVVAMTLL